VQPGILENERAEIQRLRIHQGRGCPPDRATGNRMEGHGTTKHRISRRLTKILESPIVPWKHPKRTNRNKAPFTDGEELTRGDTQYAGHRVRGIELGAASSAFRKERARRNVLVGIRPERPAQ
jgi:hypothetical protein